MIPWGIQKRLEYRRSDKQKLSLLRASSGLDISGVETLCVALGPYRSHGSRTASLIARLPRCRAINHGGAQVLGDPRLDFIAHCRRGTVDRFIRYGMYVATDGRSERRDAGQDRVLFWNEPLPVARHLRSRNIRIARLLEREPRLRFLMTVRNPVDCALSNYRSGTGRLMGLPEQAPPEAFLEKILREIAWFLELAHHHPDRFFWFLADEFDREEARRLAAFLGVEAPDAWLDRAVAHYRVSGPPAGKWHAALEARKRQLLEQPLFRNLPHGREWLAAFA